jgi:AbrB family looped-hinge helix DNA binding protein
VKAIVSEEGKVTIPKGLRDTLGIRKGTVLEFEAVAGKLVAVKKSATDGFMRWRGKGKLPGDSGVDEYLSRVRG